MICRYFSNLSIIYRDYSDIITQSYNTFIKLSLFLQILWINHDFTTPLPPISELVTHMAFKYGSSHPSRDPQLRPGWRGSRLGKSRRGQPGVGLGGFGCFLLLLLVVLVAAAQKGVIIVQSRKTSRTLMSSQNHQSCYSFRLVEDWDGWKCVERNKEQIRKTSSTNICQVAFKVAGKTWG